MDNTGKKSGMYGNRRCDMNEWHNIKENPQDLPNKTAWYVVKIKSSDNLRIVFGYEKITADHYDAWVKVECPY